MFHVADLSLCFYISSLLSLTYSARILGVFPTPALSHQLIFRAYTQELARRGHELVIITANPALPKDRPPDNITEIDVGFSYDALVHMDRSGMERGVAYGPEILYRVLLQFLVDESHRQFKQPAIRKFLEDNNQNFDLIVLEAAIDYPLLVTEIIKAPVIQISTFYGASENYEAVGAPSRHPVLYPDYSRTVYGDSFWNKLKGIYEELKIIFEYRGLEQRENELLKDYFGSDAPTISKLKENVDLLFVNSHKIFVGNRPVPSSVVFLGSLHLEKVKEIPKDIKTFLDDSKRGVVYVSFGTNVPISLMDKGLVEIFLNAFGSLDYDVMWKFDGEKPTKISKNLWLQDWFPQRDLLMHPNIKAFVTQGGRQSLDEAIDAGVPMVGIPFIGDQSINVMKNVELGMSAILDPLVLTVDKLVEAITRVVEDKSFRINVEKIRAIINDQPETPMERAMWWTEHLLRHKGGRHLRAPGANITWARYLMLDVLGPLLLLILIALLLFSVILQFILRKVKLIFGLNKVKTS